MPQMGVDGTTGDVIVTYGNGVTSQFTANMDGSFTSPPTDLGTLRSSGGGFTYTSFNGDVEQFNSSGQLTNTTNPNGVGTTYTYNGGGNLGGVQYPDGRTYTFAYNGDYIKTITGPGGTVTTLTYDGGNLVGVTQSDGVGLSFEYDVDNNLTNISQGDDSIWIVYDDNEIPYQVYDSAESTHPYVVKTLVSEAMTPYDNNVATITDPFGNITTYAMDNSGRPTQTTYPDGSTRSSQYNSADQVTETVDQLGTTTSYDYDGSGDVSRVTVSDPSVTTYTYDPTYHKVATKTDPDGRVTTFVYDSTGDLVSQTNALGTTTYTWSTGAPVTSATPPALANPGTQVNDVGDGVALQLAATDPVGAPLVYSQSGLPAGLRLSSTGLIYGTVTTSTSATVTVSVTDGVNTAPQTFHWTVGSAPSTTPSQFIITPVATNVAAGAPVTFSVTAEDGGNLVTTGFSGAVSIISSDGSATLPSSPALTNGVGTFTAIFNTSGSPTLSVYLGSARNTITMSVGTPAPTLWTTSYLAPPAASRPVCLSRLRSWPRTAAIASSPATPAPCSSAATIRWRLSP